MSLLHCSLSLRFMTFLPLCSAAGKILRRELKEQAKKEILTEPEFTGVKAKL